MKCSIVSVQVVLGLFTAMGGTDSATKPLVTVGVEGRTAAISTNRWGAVIENGIVVGFTNKMTGEEVAKKEADAGFDLPMGLGHQAEAIEEARKLHSPWGCMELKLGMELGQSFPSQHRPTARSRFTWKKLSDGSGLVLEYAGLSGGKKEYPQETYTLTARVGAASGDLLLQASGSSPNAGVYGVNTALANVGKEQTLYFAHFGGAAIDSTWPLGQMSFQETGPFLEAPVILGETAKGSWAFWAEDPKCSSTFLLLRHSRNAFHVSWETMNLMPHDIRKEAASVTWHLNCFNGSWVAAARPYRQWFQKTYAKLLAKRAPEWAKRIRIVLDAWILNDPTELRALANRFDPETVLIHDWNVRAPEFDAELPDFTPRAGKTGAIALCHEYGFKTMGYVNTYCVNVDSPLYKANNIADFLLLRTPLFGEKPKPSDLKPGQLVYVDPLSKRWREFHAKQMAELVKATGLDALYEDTAGYVFDAGNGVVEGLQAGQGGTAAMAAVQEACPKVAFASEYGTEPIAPVSLWPLRYNFVWGNSEFRERLSLSQRPVETCLFGEDQRSWVPTIRAESAQSWHWSVDYADALGGLCQVRPGQDRWRALRGDNAMMIARAQLFSQRQLRPVLPETRWEPNVRCYYEDYLGRRYKVVEDHGQAMVGPDGRPVYCRTRGASAVTNGMVVPGWPAYSLQGPVGLHPKRRYSLLRGKPETTAIRVAALPDGAFVRGYREHPSFAVLCLAPLEEKKELEVEVRFQLSRKANQLAINGVMEAAPEVGAEVVRSMKLPGGIVAISGVAASVDANGYFDRWDENGALIEDALGLDTLMPCEIRYRFGLSLPGGTTEPACLLNPPGEMLHVLDYLVRVPKKTSALRVVAQQAQTKYGNGSAARIEVNGVEVLNYALPRDASFHEWLVPLGQYANNAVVLSLITDPLNEANADLHRWTRPKIVDAAEQSLMHREMK